MRKAGLAMPNRSDASVVAVSCGVDWISATLGRGELDNQVWLNDAIHVMEKIAMEGNAYKRRSLLGFDGWECAGCFIGSNEKMHYAQFAGHWANDAYPYLEHPKVHISRLDLQVTVQYSFELLKEGRYQYARAIAHNKVLPTHRQRKINLFAGSDGGDTVYVGAVSSSQRGRVYNKDKQSGSDAFRHSWRFEVVYRNEYGDKLYRSCPVEVREATDFIISQVVIWYRERGINILGLDDWSGVAVVPTKPPKSDAGRKLAWIKAQVVPTIRVLAEMGYAEELMEVIAEAIAAGRNEQT